MPSEIIRKITMLTKSNVTASTLRRSGKLATPWQAVTPRSQAGVV